MHETSIFPKNACKSLKNYLFLTFLFVIVEYSNIRYKLF